MIELLCFIAGLTIGGAIAIGFMSCFQLHKNNEYESQIQRLKNELNNK